MLKVENLQVNIGEKPILRGVDLWVKAGETHVIMGPNGSGKSTLANVLAGREDYQVTAGRMLLEDEDLGALTPEERAHRGLFLAFQYPVEIPGLTNLYFLRASVNAHRRARGEPEYDAVDFIELVQEKSRLLGLDLSLVHRAVNAGFSGGEKKRNEILQMALLEPRLGILDETDSGLDIDAVQAVSMGVNALRTETRALLLITHYQRILKYIVPDRVHVLVGGKIAVSGDRGLAEELERRGYADFGSDREPAEVRASS
jgi:Fe-S cluster assembly ATP-binding protein